MMKLFLLASALVGVSYAIVCTQDICEGVQQPLLDCQGGILEKSGFCGCTDSCAKVEGELCRLPSRVLLGVPNLDVCDEGLECAPVYLENGFNAVCVNRTKIGNEMLASRKRRSTMMVCPPNACENVERPLLDCQGGVLKNAGFCGCTDLCAKVKGEACQPADIGGLLFGSSNAAVCDDGLECKRVDLEGHITYSCQDPNELGSTNLMSKRSGLVCDSPCRRKSLQCTFSMVIYPGQWFAHCDYQGNFYAHQCTHDKKECFCVDTLTGTIDESTRGALGTVEC